MKALFRGLYYLLLNIAQALWLGATSLLWMSAALVVSLFSSELPLAMARRYWGPWLIWGAGARIQVTGGASLDPGRPYVFVMNHQSMLDIPVAFAHIPVNLRFIAKKVLKSVPFLGWYMSRTRMVFVDRSNRCEALASLKKAGEQVRAGSSILAYPEGTRGPDSRILPFKKGPFVLAIEAGVPVVPVCIEGSGTVLPRGAFRIRPGSVGLCIGEPIPTTNLTQDDLEVLIKRVRDSMIDAHLSLGGLGGDKDDAVALPGKEGIGAGRPIRNSPAS